MKRLIKSLARNESTIVNNSTIIRDIEGNENDTIHRDTVVDYMEVLRNIFILNEIPAFSTNVRSTIRIRHTSKKRLVDPSLSCSALDLTFEQAKSDLHTFGFLFESMCIRDLQIYAESLGGNIYHYNDNTGLEIDTIIELPGGKYGAFEIKLGTDEIEKAAKNLLKFKDISDQKNKPSVLCVIVGDCTNAYLRDDGVYIVPITALKQ